MLSRRRLGRRLLQRMRDVLDPRVVVDAVQTEILAVAGRSEAACGSSEAIGAWAFTETSPKSSESLLGVS